MPPTQPLPEIPASLRTVAWDADTDRPGGHTWRETCHHIYQYMQRDMRDAIEQLRLLYPDTWREHVPRTQALVWRLMREQATLYRLRPPSREFRGLPPATADLLHDHYRRARVNKRLRTANEHLVCLANATVWIIPRPDGRGVKAWVPPPHWQHVQMASPFDDEVDEVAAWWVRVPIVTDVVLGLVVFAWAYVSSTRAVWVDGPSEMVGRGLWHPDGINPIGMIPIAMLRACDPATGDWFCEVPGDLLDGQRAVNQDSTDAGHVARLQGHGQAYASGTKKQVAEMQLGPERVVAVPQGGVFGFAQPNADLAGIQQTCDGYVNSVVASQGMNPATIMKSAGITAVAKQIELADREVERRSMAMEFADAEQRCADLTARWLNYQHQSPLVGSCTVYVQHREPNLPADPLHHAQAIDLRIKLGLTSSARERSIQEGIPVEEALDLCIEDRRLQQRLEAACAPTEPASSEVDGPPQSRPKLVALTS